MTRFSKISLTHRGRIRMIRLKYPHFHRNHANDNVRMETCFAIYMNVSQVRCLKFSQLWECQHRNQVSIVHHCKVAEIKQQNGDTIKTRSPQTHRTHTFPPPVRSVFFSLSFFFFTHQHNETKQKWDKEEKNLGKILDFDLLLHNRNGWKKTRRILRAICTQSLISFIHMCDVRVHTKVCEYWPHLIQLTICSSFEIYVWTSVLITHIWYKNVLSICTSKKENHVCTQQ